MGLALDEPEKDETAVPVNGIELLVDKDIRSFTEGTVVDFLSSPYGEMFTVENGLAGC